MPTKVGISKLNASTMDILNTIRANASLTYQQYVPQITDIKQITSVGDAIMGYPSLANEFISALVNRIAFVRIKSATFNNAYAKFKKGYLENGETIEEVFVNLCKAREFSVEKAEQREFKRTIPDVRTAFHNINYKVQYPITIQEEDLRMAFISMSGVTDLIARIIDAVYTSAEYDEFLLFKYLLIKGITKGKFYPVGVDMTDIKNSAVKFRGISNALPFISTKYNASGVHTNTAKNEQEIFMDADFNAQFDVNVLASAFNMDKADFMGRLNLIDSWTSFDNDRFDVIRANCDGLEEVTDAELALMANVKAVIVDPEWFQVYDNLNRMTEQYVASGLYWNYFYNIWKTVSTSPFSNAIVFVDDSADTAQDDNVTLKVTSIVDAGSAKIYTIEPVLTTANLKNKSVEFVQDDATTIQQGVAVHKYGAYVVPTGATITGVYPKVKIGGVLYTSGTALDGLDDVGDTATATRNDFIGDTLSAFSVATVTNSPTFNANTYNYTGTYSAAATARAITATKSDSDATVKLYKKVGTGDWSEITGDSPTIAMSSDGHYYVKAVVTGVSEGTPSVKEYVIDITAS